MSVWYQVVPCTHASTGDIRRACSARGPWVVTGGIMPAPRNLQYIRWLQCYCTGSHHPAWYLAVPCKHAATCSGHSRICCPARSACRSAPYTRVVPINSTQGACANHRCICGTVQPTSRCEAVCIVHTTGNPAVRCSSEVWCRDLTRNLTREAVVTLAGERAACSQRGRGAGTRRPS